MYARPHLLAHATKQSEPLKKEMQTQQTNGHELTATVASRATRRRLGERPLLFAVEFREVLGQRPRQIAVEGRHRFQHGVQRALTEERRFLSGFRGFRGLFLAGLRLASAPEGPRWAGCRTAGQ